jgi:hypothetical protein
LAEVTWRASAEVTLATAEATLAKEDVISPAAAITTTAMGARITPHTHIRTAPTEW